MSMESFPKNWDREILLFDGVKGMGHRMLTIAVDHMWTTAVPHKAAYCNWLMVIFNANIVHVMFQMF